MTHRNSRLFLAAVVLALGIRMPVRAYVEVPMSFGAVVNQSTTIVLMQVEQVDTTKNLIIYRKVRDLKGKHPADVIKHNIGRGGLRPGEWKVPMDWAAPGKFAVFFHNGGASETCIDRYWYQAYAGGEWWNHSHGEPFLLRSYAGPPQKLGSIVPRIVAGEEVVVPCMVDGDKNALHERRARIQRVRASLKLLDYNPTRDFVGWGGEDFLAVSGMAAFSHASPIGGVGPEAQAISSIDFDNDGRLDVCLIGARKVALYQNAGTSLNEVALPLPGGFGARAAVWADYNADGFADLLLASPAGPKLLTNLEGRFRDDSHLLPAVPGCTLTSAGWLDYDRDGKPDIVLANGYHGLRLYRNLGKLVRPPLPSKPRFGKWQYLGPFDNSDMRAFDRAHPVEQSVDLKQTYPGKGGTTAAWKEGTFTDGQVNSLALFQPEHNANAVVYLYRQIDVATPTAVPVSLGSDDTLTVWLNGKKLLAENTYRACAPDQARINLPLEAGTNHLLLKICQGTGDWGFYFKADGHDTMTPDGHWFEDVSVAVGLGPDGLGGGLKTDSLQIGDVTGDDLPDIIHGAGSGMLFVSRKDGDGKFAFVEQKAGLAYTPGKIAPVLGDYNNDGFLDLFVPQTGTCKLYQGSGKGEFVDVTAKSGDLAKPMGRATSAAWGDLDNDGHLDLMVGCLHSCNRFYRNRGDGTFEDATEAIGLHRTVYNTQALALIDFNKDGMLDLVMNNEGQDGMVLLGKRDYAKQQTVLDVTLGGLDGVVNGRVRILNGEGAEVARTHILGGTGRGGQPPPGGRFVLTPGMYRVEATFSSGVVKTEQVTLEESPVHCAVGVPPKPTTVGMNPPQ